MDNFRPVTAVEQLLYEILQEQYKTNQLLEQLLEQKQEPQQVRKPRKRVNSDV